MTVEEYQTKIDQLLSAQEATFQKPDRSSYVTTLLIIAACLLLLLGTVYATRQTPTLLERGIVEKVNHQ